jgi:hypothetical protein
MAFHEERKPEQINYIGVPVSVAVSFKSTGEMLPLQMQVHDEYGDPLRVKIGGVKYTKDIKGGLSYRVFYMSGTQRRECTLNYYVKMHQWYLES